MDWLAIVSYLAIQSITPGPHNLTCLYLGAKYPFKISKRFMLGSLTAFFIKVLFCGLLNILLAIIIPDIVSYMKWVGGAYLLYLAFVMGKSGFIEEKEDKNKNTESTYLSGIMLQVLNIKSWVASLSVFAAYVMPYTRSVWAIIAVAVVFFILCIFATVIWFFFGNALSKLINKNKKVFGITMALVLLFFAVDAVL